MTIRGLNCRRNTAFTLLEVILSLSIGLILLGALCFALSSQIRLTQMGRDILDDSTVARAVLTRISSDIQATLPPIDLRVLPDSAAPEASEDAPADENMTTEQAETGDAESATKPKSTTMTTTVIRNTVQFNIGVEGGEDFLILTVGRAQRLGGASAPTEASGLRRILYWILPGGGLARYEIKSATGEEVKLTPTDVPDPESKVIAPEVMALGFEYFDGSSWGTTWRGSDPAGDLNNPIGPPSAIRISLTIRRRGIELTPEGEERMIQIQHVVAIPTGNHFPQGGS